MRKYAPALSEIDRLISAGKHTEATARCKTIDVSSLSEVDRGYYCILSAEAGLHVGVYHSDLINKAIENFRFDDDTAMFARAKFLKGWLLSALGQYLDAKEVLLEAYTNYLRCNCPRDAARALNRLSFVVFHTGDIATAIRNLEKCRDIYLSLNDSPNETDSSINLSYLYFMCGRLRDSLVNYSQIRNAVMERDEKQRLIFNFMSAIPHALTGDIQTARKTIAKCKPSLDKYKREKAIYFENLGWICLLDKDYAGAEEALKQGLEISLEIAPESALVSQIKRLMGDLYLAKNDIDLAGKYTDEALVVAEKIRERVEIAACYRIYAQLAQRRKQPAKAREWYQKAIDLFSQIGARYELAVTRYLAASGGTYDDGERTAMFYLAREYFSSEKVAHYVDMIDRELGKSSLSTAPALRRRDNGGDGCPVIIASNPEMQKILSLAANVSQSDMTVFLTGPTGTGKDLMAKYIHYHSGRKGQLVTVNAAAIPASMVESELFGYARGAFTGADKEKPGLFEIADGGTFYLNEVADASAEFQAKLLEVLESKRVRRLGENKGRQVDFRLIAATNHDLETRMKENLFRCDLYHRLNEIPITLPPLCDRREDIPGMVKHFLSEFGFEVDQNGSSEVFGRFTMILSRQDWPGNVRELLAQIKYYYVTCGDDLVRMTDLALGNGSRSEKDHLLEVLEMTGWNRSKAASMLGVSEGTIRNRIKKYRLSKFVS